VAHEVGDAAEDDVECEALAHVAEGGLALHPPFRPEPVIRLDWKRSSGRLATSSRSDDRTWPSRSALLVSREAISMTAVSEEFSAYRRPAARHRTG